jgi:general stress protein 26
MSTDPNDRAAVEKRLWKELDDARFGMLGLTNGHQHFQPMTAFAEPEGGQIWFFTKEDTDLARSANGGAEAMLIVQSKDQEFRPASAACCPPHATPSASTNTGTRCWRPGFPAARTTRP